MRFISSILAFFFLSLAVLTVSVSGQSGDSDLNFIAANLPTLKIAQDSYFAGFSVGSSISWAGGKLNRITDSTASFRCPSNGQMIEIVRVGDQFNKVATDCPDIKKVYVNYLKSQGNIPQSMRGRTFDAVDADENLFHS